MSETIASEVSAGFTLTFAQSGLAVTNEWTQSYSLTFEPSSAYPAQTMMLSSPSPGPIDVGRFVLGPDDADAGAEADAAPLPPALAAGADAAADGDGDAEPLHAATTIASAPTLAASDRDLMTLLLRVPRSGSCAAASR